MNTTSNRFDHKELIGSHITMQDGRTGDVTHAGYGLITVQLDPYESRDSHGKTFTADHWVCGPDYAIL